MNQSQIESNETRTKVFLRVRVTTLTLTPSPSPSNFERLLQIEFLSPLDDNNQPFELNELKLLTNSLPSNIDTYEFVFQGNLVENHFKLFFDQELFLSEEEQYIDTLRLIFNFTLNERVEWELVKSIQLTPDSPCPQQITSKNRVQFYIIITVTLLFFSFASSYSLVFPNSYRCVNITVSK